MTVIFYLGISRDIFTPPQQWLEIIALNRALELSNSLKTQSGQYHDYVIWEH